jgi:AcrR family transcriptional regulator
MLTLLTYFAFRDIASIRFYFMAKAKPDYHHGDLKRALLDAAFEILKRDGHQGLSMRKLAEHAGVSPAAPYRHYADLEALYAELAREGFILLTEKLARTRARFKKNALLQFRTSGIAYVEFAQEQGDLFQMMYGNAIADHSLHPALIAAEEEAFAILRAILLDCQNANLVRQGDIAEMATAAWVMVHGMAHLLLGNQVMLRNLGRRRARGLTKQMIEHLYVGLK